MGSGWGVDCDEVHTNIFIGDKVSTQPLKVLVGDPSLDSSIGSTSAWYLGGPRFKSQQRQNIFNENKYLIYSKKGIQKSRTNRSYLSIFQYCKCLVYSAV